MFTTDMPFIKENICAAFVHLKDNQNQSTLFFIASMNLSKKFGRKSAKNRKNRPNYFCPKSAEMKILFCKVGMGIKLYEINIFDLCYQKFELML